MTSFWGMCRQNECSWHVKPEFAEHKAWFGHYWRKGRDTLIEIILEYEILRNPYVEPTYILANKLVQISKIESENKEK